MNKFNFQSVYSMRLFFLLLIILCLGSKCNNTEKKILVRKKPVLVIVGVDNSKSFDRYSKFDVDNLSKICEELVKSRRGGTVVFKLIGAPDVREELKVEVISDSLNCGDLPASKRLECKRNKQKIKAQREEILDDFLRSCRNEMLRSLESDTDINGFFKRMSLLTSQINYRDYEKFMFIYSDGLHDVTSKNGQRDKKLDCTLLPANCVNSVCGWTEKIDCSIQYKFTTPGGFIDFLTKEL